MKKLVAGLGLAVLTVAAAHAHAGAHNPDGTAGHPGEAKNATRTVKLDLKEYSFSEPALTFKAGETVKFVVTNSGRLKHELTIGTAEEQEAHRKEMQAMSDMKHDENAHGMHKMPENSIHVAPGETRQLVWTFSKAGSLAFACNYPGHADLGMEGKITVR